MLGATGLLGSAITAECVNHFPLDVLVTARNLSDLPALKAKLSYRYEHGVDSLTKLITTTHPDVVINAIGVTRARILAQSISDQDVWSANSALPNALSSLSQKHGYRLLHVSTDCVFESSMGGHTESDPVSPIDLYGVSKASGEFMASQQAVVLRTSFVGQHKSGGGLMSWLGNQPYSASVPGFTNQIWNGLTTTALSQIIVGWVMGSISLAPLQHLHTAQALTKYDLLLDLSRRLCRQDLRIVPTSSNHSVDRTLACISPEKHSDIWKSLGFNDVPDFKDII